MDSLFQSQTESILDSVIEDLRQAKEAAGGHEFMRAEKMIEAGIEKLERLRESIK
jgi:hypothetical protein